MFNSNNSTHYHRFCTHNNRVPTRICYGRPQGSANPEVDITNLSPRLWYQPNQIGVNVNETNVNETIALNNNDTKFYTSN